MDPWIIFVSSTGLEKTLTYKVSLKLIFTSSPVPLKLKKIISYIEFYSSKIYAYGRKILNNATPYKEIMASYEGDLHS